MPIALHSFKIDDDEQVRICHTFYGETEAAAKQLQHDHARDCPHYGPALAAGNVLEVMEEIDELPEANEDSVLDLLGFDDEDDDDDAEK